MFKKIYYTWSPKLSTSDVAQFWDKNYDCVRLYLTKFGKPVTVSESKDPQKPVWKVQYGFSQLFLKTYAEVTAYCKKRFCDLDGKPLKEVKS